MILYRYVTMADSLHQNHVGWCPLSEVYLKHIMFWELGLDWVCDWMPLYWQESFTSYCFGDWW